MSNPLRPVFQCQQCGECCRGKGGIILTDTEIVILAKYLHIPVEEFRCQYVEPSALGPTLRTDDAGMCIFNHNGLCRVHPVKPRICREWPFLPAILADPEELELAKGACPGIAPDCSHAEFVRWWQENVS